MRLSLARFCNAGSCCELLFSLVQSPQMRHHLWARPAYSVHWTPGSVAIVPTDVLSGSRRLENVPAGWTDGRAMHWMGGTDGVQNWKPMHWVRNRRSCHVSEICIALKCLITRRNCTSFKYKRAAVQFLDDAEARPELANTIARDVPRNELE